MSARVCAKPPLYDMTKHTTKNNNIPQTSNISRTLVGDNIVDHSNVAGASPVGTDPTTSSFFT